MVIFQQSLKTNNVFFFHLRVFAFLDRISIGDGNLSAVTENQYCFFFLLRVFSAVGLIQGCDLHPPFLLHAFDLRHFLGVGEISYFYLFFVLFRREKLPFSEGKVWPSVLRRKNKFFFTDIAHRRVYK